jgi:mono/diheme cytochrome c family protein
MKKLILRGLLPLVTLAATSCVSLEQAAPRPAALPFSGGARLGQLERGRELYVTKCARCHSVEPVTRYSAQEWREIVPDMARKAKLGPADEAAVEAYVFAVLRVSQEAR